jgi:hypothetical protein
VSMHLPVRPAWTCGACDLVWPCPTRKRQLVAEFDGARVSLMLYLSAYFVEACADLPAAAVGDLYERFFIWPRQVHRNAHW